MHQNLATSLLLLKVNQEHVKLRSIGQDVKRIEDNSSIQRSTIDQMIKDASEEQKKLVSIIIKADVHGSEAIEQSLKK